MVRKSHVQMLNLEKRKESAQLAFRNTICTLKFVITVLPNHGILLFYRTGRSEKINKHLVSLAQSVQK